MKQIIEIGSIVRPIDPKHPWRIGNRCCTVRCALVSRRRDLTAQERPLILFLQVEGYPLPIFQWAKDFEVVEPEA